MRGTVGGSVAVGAAAALFTVGLAAGPLFVSAAASEAVQVGLERTCGADAGLTVPVPFFLDAGIEDELDTMAAGVAHTEAPIRTQLGNRAFDYRAEGGNDDLTDRIVLLSRDGQFDELDVSQATLDDRELLAPESAEERAGVSRGDVLVVDVPASSRLPNPPPPAPLRLTVAGRYADVPFLPEPSYWCGLRDLFRPNISGDLPPMVMLVEPAVLTQLPEDAVGHIWELRPDSTGITRHDAERLIDDYAQITAAYEPRLRAAYEEAREQGGVPFRVPDVPEPALSSIVTQAETVADVVGRTVAPIRLAGAAAGGLLLTGAGVLVARERRRELRLRVLRGDGPLGLAMRTCASQGAPAIGGAVAGTALAFAAVRVLGPTPELEPGPVREAILAGAIGAVLAMLLVAAVVAAVATRSVDAPARHRHRVIPWELLLVALAVAAYLRLDRVGGVRLVGADAKGGDLLAQAFPLLALVAASAVCLRPFTWLARRSRRIGGGLPTPMLIGVRRVGAEPGTSAAIAVAIALAVGVFVVATGMTDSARQLLDDKAATYLGSDEVVTVVELLELPPGLSGTVVGRLGVRSDGLNVNVIGVDPTTFPDAVAYRRDGADSSLAVLLDSISGASPDAPLAAIVVGGELSSTTLETYNRQELVVAPVATAHWFPGQHAGATYVVVDRDALARTGLALAEEVWLREPPPDARDRLAAAGFTVRGSLRAGDVFDVISFLAVKWSYSALRAFAVMVGLVLLFAQLLVLDARRRSRQAAFVLTRPMGSGVLGEGVAVLTELAVPFVAGLLMAVPLSVAVLHVAVPRFDTLRQLPPPARVVLVPGTFLGAVGVGAAALVGLAMIGAIGVARARPMRVMRDVA
ncbi:MAG: hypothetical protein AB7Q42_22410 [Acidimicrobiia bacterium]